MKTFLMIRNFLLLLALETEDCSYFQSDTMEMMDFFSLNILLKSIQNSESEAKTFIYISILVFLGSILTLY